MTPALGDTSWGGELGSWGLWLGGAGCSEMHNQIAMGGDSYPASCQTLKKSQSDSSFQELPGKCGPDLPSRVPGVHPHLLVLLLTDWHISQGWPNNSWPEPRQPSSQTEK